MQTSTKQSTHQSVGATHVKRSGKIRMTRIKLHGPEIYEGVPNLESTLSRGRGTDYHAQMYHKRFRTLIEILLEETDADTIVEVGSEHGWSATTMCEVANRVGKPLRKLYCVDTWLGGIEHWDSDDPDVILKRMNGYPQMYYQFLANVIHAGHENVISPIPTTSDIGCRILKECRVKPQLIYIDASHDETDVYNDIRNYCEILAPGGIIFGDDWGWESVRKAVERYADDYEIDFTGGVYEDTWWMFSK